MRAAALLLALAALLLAAVAVADPREVESSEFQEEFGDELETGGVRTVDAEARLELQLEHQLGRGAAFSPRGKVEIVQSAGAAKPKVTFSGVPSLSDAEVELLEGMLRSNELYTVRAKADPEDPASPYVMTSVPVCLLAATRLREDFSFHLTDDGKLMAIDFVTPYVSQAACAEYQKRGLSSAKLSPYGTALKAQDGPAPPKNIVVRRDKAPQGVKPVQNDNEEPPAEESQSFLRKYWYIILPIVIMSLFGGGDAGAPPAGGAPAAGGAGGPRRR